MSLFTKKDIDTNIEIVTTNEKPMEEKLIYEVIS